MMKIKGWVLKKRIMGKIGFIDLKSVDKPWKIRQIVIKDTNLLEMLKNINQMDFLEIEGEIKKEPRAPGGKEIHASSIHIESKTIKPWPLGKKSHGPDYLLNVRHLSVRSPTFSKIFLFESYTVKFLREFLESSGWIEVFPPTIIFSACEGGADLFEIEYYDQKAYLSESAQLYLEALIYSLGKVYSLGPSFRAEKSRTKRHLSEFRHLEAEAALYDFDKILDIEEKMIRYTIEQLLKNEITSEILKDFRKKEKEWEVLESSRKRDYPKIPYSEVLKILKSYGRDKKFGEDLGSDDERLISELYSTPVFVTHYPTSTRSFYVKKVPSNPSICYSADLLAPEGFGEITTGGQREDDYDSLVKEIKSRGLELAEYDWYLDLRKYGSVIHSGFGLGIERFTRWLLKLDHIRDATPFPRMYRRKKLV